MMSCDDGNDFYQHNATFKGEISHFSMFHSGFTHWREALIILILVNALGRDIVDS